ncbi:MAG: hypothetical protein R3C30_14100 [Hyphomonadaceae bacterium]
MSDEIRRSVRQQRFDLQFFACIAGGLGLAALAVVMARYPELISNQDALIYFGGACAIPFLAAWRRAIVDGRLPAIPTGSPKHDHITGWGFLALAFVIATIVGLAAWATSDEIADRRIHAEFGIAVVFGLAVLFAAAALLPIVGKALSPFGVTKAASRLLAPLQWIARPFGLVLSFIDGILVFAVAGGAGASQPWPLVRYVLLACSIIPCGILGFYLPPPLGLIPIAWGFVVAISISRRWAWVEDDRDVYMLNRRYQGAHVRIGFAQDLRDEALLSFMSMFFLVPLALRQFHDWSVISGQPLFTIDPEVTVHLLDWIGYYGTELAKAVPFVDWAEIYQVEGAAPIEATTQNSRHVVFATRVLVDLVFLAALLQALSISARNAKQMDLFKAGVMDRLDPFIEPDEFRKLVFRDSEGKWREHEANIQAFPKYDPLRLAELSSAEHHPINIAAKALRRRDGSDDAARFQEQLIERAFQKRKDADAIDEVLTAIRMTGAPVDVEALDRVRIELNHRRPMNAIRETIMKLVSQASPGDDRTAALLSALVGQTEFADGQAPTEIRDAVAPVRRIALGALGVLAAQGDLKAIAAIDTASSTDPAGNVQNAAKEILASIRGSK